MFTTRSLRSSTGFGTICLLEAIMPEELLLVCLTAIMVYVPLLVGICVELRLESSQN